ncbi:glycoside hydrolase family 16 protein [Sphingomonas sp. RB3P16]|uniref:glycoside hydrolase family 16 protein n=1 Tax=Parasphingomonas frigoris TaxID=3096163 RepID=UPI002FC86352
MRALFTSAAVAATGLAVAIVGSPAPVPPAVLRSGPPAGYAMTPSFSEEFSAPLDPRKWNLAYGARTSAEPSVGSRSLWNNGEAQIYFDRKYLKLGIDPFSFANGVMTISARPLPTAARDAVFGDLARHPDLLKGLKTLPRIEYSSGAITTRDTFKQRYGYFEIRAAWAGGKGVWPAFWLLPADGGWPPEIDVLEAHGNKAGTVFQSIHSKRTPTVTNTVRLNISQADFHTYGALWVPGRIDFYVDGALTSTAPETADMNQPMYLLANMAIGGGWPGYPDPDPNFAATMRIDFIRAWQFRGPPPSAPRAK